MSWRLTHAFAHAGGSVRYGVEGSGPPLVLVHGTPWSSFNWRHVIAALAPRWPGSRHTTARAPFRAGTR